MKDNSFLLIHLFLPTITSRNQRNNKSQRQHFFTWLFMNVQIRKISEVTECSGCLRGSNSYDWFLFFLVHTWPGYTVMSSLRVCAVCVRVLAQPIHSWQGGSSQVQRSRLSSHFVCHLKLVQYVGKQNNKLRVLLLWMSMCDWHAGVNIC